MSVETEGISMLECRRFSRCVCLAALRNDFSESSAESERHEYFLVLFLGFLGYCLVVFVVLVCVLVLFS